MHHKTFLSTLGLLVVAGFVVVASLNSVYSGDGKRPEPNTRAASSETDRSKKPSWRELRAEIGALRADMQKVLALLEQQGNAAPLQQVADPVAATERVSIFPLEFVRADEVAQIISNVVKGASVSVLYDESRLVVVADTAEMERVAQTIEKLDRARPQVRIESYLYELAVDDLDRLGLQSNEIQGAITGQVDKQFSLKTTIKTLSTTDGARLLARPIIRAYDRTTATFQSVQEIPVQTLTQTEGGTIGTTEFREAGITMEVTPRITTSGTIIMEVHPEYSVMQGFVDGQPVIDRRSATATVVVRDGESIVISGLRSQGRQIADEQAETATGETELLIILKAEIIDDRDE
jgi:type II secretory pathway component GspD/PulD (secretin)